MTSDHVLIGIDVSAQELSVATLHRGRLSAAKSWPNTAQGFSRLIGSLRSVGGPLRVCLEVTGVYSLGIAKALCRAQIPVMMVNPAQARDFARALLKRNKTDALDAAVLAQYAARMEFRAWQPPSKQTELLRDVTRRMVALKQCLIRERSRLHAAHRARTDPLVTDDIRSLIQHLQSRIRRLHGHAQQIVSADPKLSQWFPLLLSIKGIGTTTALMLLGELAWLPDGMSAKQWAAYAGLAPCNSTSGTSVHRKPRVGKQGNRRLRACLMMPALAAICHDPTMKRINQELLARGKTKMQAVGAIMHKLLRVAYGVVHTQTMYNPHLAAPREA